MNASLASTVLVAQACREHRPRHGKGFRPSAADMHHVFTSLVFYMFISLVVTHHSSVRIRVRTLIRLIAHLPLTDTQSERERRLKTGMKHEVSWPLLHPSVPLPLSLCEVFTPLLGSLCFTSSGDVQATMPIEAKMSPRCPDAPSYSLTRSV